MGEIVADGLLPALDNAVRATDDSKVTSDDAGSENSRQCLACSGARPVADPLTCLDASSDEPLHQIRRRGFPVDLKSVALRNTQFFCPTVLIKELFFKTLNILAAAKAFGLSDSSILVAKSVFPDLIHCRGEQEFDGLFIGGGHNGTVECRQCFFS